MAEISLFDVLKEVTKNQTPWDSLDESFKKQYSQFMINRFASSVNLYIIPLSEIDRYTNGESKISLDKIEISCGNKLFNRSGGESFIRNDFQSLIKTTDITWLESEQSIKEARKNKLAQLKERMTE